MSQKFVLHAGDDNRMRILGNIWHLLNGLHASRSWEFEVRPYAKRRTCPQNNALWGVAYPALVAATGQEANDWHEYMLGEYFGWVSYELFGKKKVRPARTTTTDFEGRASKLSTTEFADFYAFIQKRAREYGVHIPDPDPFHKEAA